MKTPVCTLYENKIAKINNQLCYFLFSDIEFGNLIYGSIIGNEDKFTTDIFPKNEFTKRIHIYMKDLPDFRKDAFHTLMGVNIIAAVEHLLCYLEAIEKYRAAIIPSEFDTKSNEKPEEQLSEKLKGWLGKTPESAIIKTIKYLRLRRNHLAHLSEKMSNDYKSLIKNDSNYLNKFWGAKKTNIYDFDFSNEDYSMFKGNEAFSLINLTFVCMKLVDEIILSTLSENDIAKYEISEFKTNSLLNGRTLKSKTSKFNGMLTAKYGYNFEITENDYEKYAQQGV